MVSRVKQTLVQCRVFSLPSGSLTYDGFPNLSGPQFPHL